MPGCATDQQEFIHPLNMTLSVDAIAVLLSKYWDVVGVAEIDFEPEREYLFEAETLQTLLHSGADADALAQVLTRLAAEMPVRVDEGRDRTAAERICEANT